MSDTTLPFKSSRRDLLSFLAVASTPKIVNAIAVRPEMDKYEGSLVLPHISKVGRSASLKIFPEVEHSEYLDIVPNTLYDRLKIPAGVVVPHENFIFTNVGPRSGKTYSDTNMNASQKLQAPEVFRIERAYITTPRMTNSFIRLCESFRFELILGMKYYSRSTLPLITNVIQEPLRIDRSISYDGIGGLFIESGMTFYVMISGESFIPTEPLDFWVHLDGMHGRGVC